MFSFHVISEGEELYQVLIWRIKDINTISTPEVLKSRDDSAPQGTLAMSGDIFCCHQLGEGVPLASTGWRPGITARNPTRPRIVPTARTTWPQKSSRAKAEESSSGPHERYFKFGSEGSISAALPSR